MTRTRLGLVGLASALSFGTALLIVVHPGLAVGLAVMFTMCCLGRRRLAQAALLAPAAVVVVSPQVLANLGVPEAVAAQKALVLAAAFLGAALLGWRRAGVATVIGAWVLAALLSLGFADMAPQVTGSVFGRALLGYGYVWVILGARWDRVDPKLPAVLVAFLPLVSVALGVVLQVADVQQLVRLDYDGAYRLQGALSPAHLAMAAFVGLAAALWLRAHGRWRAGWLVAVNLLIVVATLGRGATAAVIILLAVYLTFVRSLRPVQKVAVLAGVVIAVAVFVPALTVRSEDTEGLNLSGREEAWDYYWQDAQRSPWFGRGMGAGSVVTEADRQTGVLRHFTAPHNTYLQLVLDVGYVGTGLVLTAFGIMAVALWRRADSDGQALLAALGASTAAFAVTDNLLSTPQFIVPLMLLLSAIVAPPCQRGEADSRKAHGISTRYGIAGELYPAPMAQHRWPEKLAGATGTTARATPAGRGQPKPRPPHQPVPH